MPVPTGYYDVNRNAIAAGMSPSYPVRTPGQIVNPSGSYGLGIPNPNEPDGGWYATNLDTGSMHPVTGENYRELTNSSHSNRDLLQAAAKVATLIYGGAALSGIGAGGTAASGIGNAGLGFGGSAVAGVAPEAANVASGATAGAESSSILPSVDTIGGSAAGVPTEAVTSGNAVGGSGAGGFDWQGMLKHANPFGGSGEGGSPQYGDYSRIAEQLSKNQLQDQRKQVMAQQQAQGPSLQERRRHRIAALLQAGSPA